MYGRCVRIQLTRLIIIISGIIALISLNPSQKILWGDPENKIIATDTVIKSIGRMIARFGKRIKAVKSMISPSADKKSSKTGVCQTVPIKYMVINAVRDATKTLFKSGMLLASFI